MPRKAVATVKITVRMPRSLAPKVRERAAAQDRSLSAHLIALARKDVVRPA